MPEAGRCKDPPSHARPVGYDKITTASRAAAPRVRASDREGGGCQEARSRINLFVNSGTALINAVFVTLPYRCVWIRKTLQTFTSCGDEILGNSGQG